MIRRSVATVSASILLSLAVTFAALLMSPNDPSRAGQGRGAGPTTVVIPTELWPKFLFVLERVAAFKADSYAKGHGITTLTPVFKGLPTTLAITMPGTLLAWVGVIMLGSLLGRAMNSLLGRLLFATMFAGVVIPSPVWVEASRIGFSHLPNRIAAVITMAILTAPTMLIHHAIKVNDAYRGNDAILARAVGLPTLTVWRAIILPKTRAYWITQASLLLVSLFEGPILIESAFGFEDGLGSVALAAATQSDKPLLLVLVGTTCLLVNFGALCFARSSSAE